MKGNCDKDFDISSEDLTIHKKNFIELQMRSKEDMGALKRENELIEEAKNSKKYFDKLKVRKLGKEGIKINCELSEGFKNAVNRKKSAPKLSYIMGNKGFRPDVVSDVQ